MEPPDNSLWDLVLTRANAAYLGATAILAGLAKLYINWRRELSELHNKLNKDRSSEQLLSAETSVQIGWMRGLVERSERDALKIAALEKKIEDMNETRINDARALERKDAEGIACRERVQEMRLERDLAIEEMITTKKMLAAEQEHVIVIDELLFSYRMANAKLFAALPDGVRQQMVDYLLKTEPPKT